jgi:hypothetical protein
MGNKSGKDGKILGVVRSSFTASKPLQMEQMRPSARDDVTLLNQSEQ